MKSGIVSYDITINRYRTRLSKVLSGYGERVQLSVFEFQLEDDVYLNMLKEIEKIFREYTTFAYMKGTADDVKRSIRLYILCDGCYKKIILFEGNNRKKKAGVVI